MIFATRRDFSLARERALEINRQDYGWIRAQASFTFANSGSSRFAKDYSAGRHYFTKRGEGCSYIDVNPRQGTMAQKL